jgi:hypothetical protein
MEVLTLHHSKFTLYCALFNTPTLHSSITPSSYVLISCIMKIQ